MSTPRSTEGLRRHTTQLRASTARKIKQAIREMKKKGLPINPNSVSRYSGVSRKTIYNHTDLLTQIRAAANKPVIRPADQGEGPPTTESGIIAALRNQITALKTGHRADIAELKATIKGLNEDLAAAHGEIYTLAEQLRHRGKSSIDKGSGTASPG
ncbi:Putative transposase/integrase [Mycobacteroides abscessus]|uniref:Transposase/integrase n=6 Tax=Mycobacteroides abscessus TaxID=36809 RepID=B1MGK9_MYCA9|nr:transposase [Mycobacteroides abscessus]EUA64230.1 hypothetical protein I542_4398 [Mycobacteroides abscessus 1948]AIC72985.1 transposase [Mycobacteroides abscessus subsp. massiliense str. GO 06]ALM15230.1 transposase [Mycobacteroides abscessus]AMU24500.1 transposase [Mycobacteroides abscessus]AMU34229.1 transposase [Mycobacteroides abscessus]